MAKQQDQYIQYIFKDGQYRLVAGGGAGGEGQEVLVVDKLPEQAPEGTVFYLVEDSDTPTPTPTPSEEKPYKYFIRAHRTQATIEGSWNDNAAYKDLKVMVTYAGTKNNRTQSHSHNYGTKYANHPVDNLFRVYSNIDQNRDNLLKYIVGESQANNFISKSYGYDEITKKNESGFDYFDGRQVHLYEAEYTLDFSTPNNLMVSADNLMSQSFSYSSGEILERIFKPVRRFVKKYRDTSTGLWKSSVTAHTFKQSIMIKFVENYNETGSGRGWTGNMAKIWIDLLISMNLDYTNNKIIIKLVPQARIFE